MTEDQVEPIDGGESTALDRLDPWPMRTMAYDARFDIPRWTWTSRQG